MASFLEDGKMVELDVKIEAKDLYDYMMAHTYNSPAGIIGSCFGALMVIIGVMTKMWLYVILGAVLLLYLPWNLNIKSKQQALLNPAFKEPLHYVLDEKGITVSQGEQTQSQEWANMYKATSTTKSIIVYTTKVNATIFPRREVGEQLPALIEMISTHMPPDKVKIRF